MVMPSSFFCFTHIAKSLHGVEHRYAFAYKPPGPLMRGALDELMLSMCKGPNVPDVVVVLGLAEETQVDLLAELKTEQAKVAQQRLASRIPLVHAKIDLTSGLIKTTLLDTTFKKRTTEFSRAIQKHAFDWMQSGLRSIFAPTDVVLRAPAGYSYQKPSGSRSEFFLKPDLALRSSATVGFVALALFNKLFSGQTSKFADLQTVFVDTMAIAPVAYALRDLLELHGFNRPFQIESFHSYGGFDEVRRPLKRTSLCLISASTSMALHEQWITKKEVAVDEVVTLLTFTSAKRFKDGALLSIDPPQESSAAGPAQLSIRIHGETFLPEQEPAKKVLLTDVHHRSDNDVAHFCDLAGQHVFDIYRRPARGASKPRALYVDGALLLQQPVFLEWLEDQLLQSVKAATQLVVHQDDAPSKSLADLVANYCEQKLGLGKLALVSATQLSDIELDKRAGVIVCSAVVGKGSQLLEISRALRDMHTGPRLYLIGYQVTETRGELATLQSNLRHAKGVPYEVARFGAAAVGTQLSAAFELEQKTYYDSSSDSSHLPGRLKARAEILGTTSSVGQLALLPHGGKVASAMRLRAGFAYWPKEFEPQACHAEVLATVAVLLQRAREDAKLPEARRLASASYRHVVLDPENFSRFNDGVLQAAILRCAYPSELDYRGDYAASDFMKAVILRSLARATQEAGEGTLEFLLALATRRLQLVDAHFDEIQQVASQKSDRPSALQRAIDFVLGKDGMPARPKAKMPF